MSSELTQLGVEDARARVGVMKLDGQPGEELRALYDRRQHAVLRPLDVDLREHRQWLRVARVDDCVDRGAPAVVVVPHPLLVVRHPAAKEAEIARRLTSATI